MGSPSGIAATARETASQLCAAEELTSNCEHLQPAPLLVDPDENNNANDREGHERQSLSEVIHGKLQWRALLLDLPSAPFIYGLTSCIIEKMTPNSVSVPVPTTIPVPWPKSERGHVPYSPDRTSVPMYATHLRSLKALPPPSPCVSSPIPLSQAVVVFLAGLVSPVRADSSISRATEDNRRTSAGTRSPTLNEIRSPGTSALAKGVET